MANPKVLSIFLKIIAILHWVILFVAVSESQNIESQFSSGWLISGGLIFLLFSVGILFVVVSELIIRK